MNAKAQSAMTSKERFLTAMTGGIPDHVPCTPDFSNMIPCRLTGKPFWDIYLHGKPPLWEAYLHAARHFGIDGWFPYGHLDFDRPSPARWETISTEQTGGRLVRKAKLIAPEGELFSQTTYYVADPPTATENPIKDLKAQARFFKHLFVEPAGYTTATAAKQKAQIGEYAFGSTVGFPGFQSWVGLCQGGIEPLAYAWVDAPEILDELYALEERVRLKEVEMIIDSKMFDYLLLGGSGAVTLGSPALFDRYAFPAIQKICRLCRQAGLPTMLHSCGKEMHMVKRLAEETELDCINPLEIPPMGDCELATVKRLYGDKIALMGNLHTTDVMLKGTVEQVKAACRKAIDDAGQGGGFILSSGDQCGRDTPDENIFAMVEVAKTYGRY